MIQTSNNSFWSALPAKNQPKKQTCSVTPLETDTNSHSPKKSAVKKSKTANPPDLSSKDETTQASGEWIDLAQDSDRQWIHPARMRPPKQAVNGLIWLKILTDNDKVKNEDDEGFNNPKTFFKAPYCRPEDVSTSHIN
ncbi:hypothetical protein MJO29_000592 [Puccinia striiformis f. sp. tritici]|nr:hypothetical protein MJO29_000592 [Puccinia striiformis f. sp. tritici]